MQPLISIISKQDLPSIIELLNEHGYEKRYEIVTNNDLQQNTNDPFIQTYADYGYHPHVLETAMNEIKNGKIAIVIQDDYDDLPAIYEILSSHGHSLLDQDQANAPIDHQYQISEEEVIGCYPKSDDTWEISIPAHYVSDPTEDQPYTS